METFKTTGVVFSWEQDVNGGAQKSTIRELDENRKLAYHADCTEETNMTL